MARDSTRIRMDDLLDRAIYSSDGRFLGRAFTHDGEWFKVDAPQAIDYWLPADTVRAVVHDQVLLRIDAAASIRIRRHEPPTMAERRFEREEEERMAAEEQSDDESQDAESV